MFQRPTVFFHHIKRQLPMTTHPIDSDRTRSRLVKELSSTTSPSLDESDTMSALVSALVTTEAFDPPPTPPTRPLSSRPPSSQNVLIILRNLNSADSIRLCFENGEGF